VLRPIWVLFGFTVLAAMPSSHARSPNPAKIFRTSELNANPDYYDCKEISVRGYIVLTPEAHILYESKSLNEKWMKAVKENKENFDPKAWRKYCLTIANPRLLLNHSDALTGKTFVLTGTFLSHYLDGQLVDIGACPLPTAILLDEAEFKRTYLAAPSAALDGQGKVGPSQSPRSPLALGYAANLALPIRITSPAKPTQRPL
jgi:hypothetical protein